MKKKGKETVSSEKDNRIFFIVLALVAGLLIGYFVARQKYTTLMSIKDAMLVERQDVLTKTQAENELMKASGVVVKDGVVYIKRGVILQEEP